ENRYIGLSTHPNILGFCAMLGLALIPFLLQELPRRFSWVVLLAAASCGYGIWISGSRAALLVAGAVMVLYPLLARSIGAALVLFGLGIVPVFLVGRTLSSGEVGNNIIGRLAGGGSATASDQAREALAATTLDRFLAHPLFGVGFGEVLEAHNIYLQVAAAGGVAVLLFYIVLLLSVLRQPFAIGSSYRLLALPAMAYALIGPITPLLWDRYIWCALAIPFLVAASGKQEPAESSPHNVMTKENA
ncbi:O-antigen ligase, partial [Aeromicrobium sp.]|uniref:O-antigen ligase family protein n=1 Tax=Aeromicrobium sp. TaxID=1871063 RepID=UPI0019A80AA8